MISVSPTCINFKYEIMSKLVNNNKVDRTKTNWMDERHSRPKVHPFHYFHCLSSSCAKALMYSASLPTAYVNLGGSRLVPWIIMSPTINPDDSILTFNWVLRDHFTTPGNFLGPALAPFCWTRLQTQQDDFAPSTGRLKYQETSRTEGAFMKKSFIIDCIGI